MSRLVYNFFQKTIFFIIILSSIVASYVNSISIEGNKKTNDRIILREIQHSINVPIDSLILKQDIDRLYNLRIFSNVDIIVQNNIYTIQVTEAFSIFPIPLIDYDETKDELSLGMAVVNINFSGRDQDIFVGGKFYGEKSTIFGFYDPWIYGDHVSFGLQVYNIIPVNIFYDFKYKKINNKISFGFNKGNYKKYNFALGFLKNRITDINEEHNHYDFLNSIKNEYNYIEYNFDYQFDKRDIYIDPTKGYLFNINVSYYNGLNETKDIYKFYLFYKKYLSTDIPLLKDPVLSYKINSFLQFPDYFDLPLFEYVYLGGEEFVRGYSPLPEQAPQDVRHLIENSNIISGSLEIQNTIIKRKNYGKIEIGLDGLLFMDVGVGSYTYKKFNFNNYLLGYGVGIKVFVSSIGPISILIGTNPYGQQHLHLMDEQ